MSTIPQPLASILEYLLRALTIALEWLAYHRPTILRAGTVDELVLDRQRLWDALDELDKQGGRVLDIGSDLTLARSRLGRIASMVDAPVDAEGLDPRDLARSTLAVLDERKAKRRSSS